MDRLPVIDLSKAADPATRPQFLNDLQNALFRIGFLFLVNHGLEEECDRLIGYYAPKVFDIPQAEKDRINMVHRPHFVGYTRFGAETTHGHIDNREQFDFGSALDCDFDDHLAKGLDPPQWRRLRGPSMYPENHHLPGFEQAVKDYLVKMESLADQFLELVAESLNLPADAFNPFRGSMNRLKIIKYPGVDESTSASGRTLHEQFQGVGPHKDSSGMFTYVLQDTVGGLEVLGADGRWIKATPLKGSLVVNIAQGFEALTGGRCGATTHQVISPSPHLTRYSVPFFYSVRLDLTREDIAQQLGFVDGKIPDRVDREKQAVDVPSEFILPQYKCFGEAHLRNRIVSHKDVGRRWYPELYEKYHQSS